MSPQSPLPQEAILYSGAWTRLIDDEFINLLRRGARVKGRPISRSDLDIIKTAIKQVNRKCNGTFTLEDGKYWMKKLEMRHAAVSYIKALPYVNYNEADKVVEADEWCMWDLITLRHPIAEAYMYTAEPKWVELQGIFGPPPTAENIHYPEIVQISDTTIETLNLGESSVHSVGSPSLGTFSYQTSQNTSLGSSFWDGLQAINSAGEQPPFNPAVENYQPPPPVRRSTIYQLTIDMFWPNASDSNANRATNRSKSEGNAPASSSCSRNYPRNNYD